MRILASQYITNNSDTLYFLSGQTIHSYSMRVYAGNMSIYSVFTRVADGAHAQWEESVRALIEARNPHLRTRTNIKLSLK